MGGSEFEAVAGRVAEVERAAAVGSFDLFLYFHTFGFKMPSPCVQFRFLDGKGGVGGAIAAAAGGRMALQPFTVKSWSGVMELILTLPMRVIGLAIGLAGLAAICLGVFEMVIPAGLDRWWAGVLESLPRPPEVY